MSFPFLQTAQLKSDASTAERRHLWRLTRPLAQLRVPLLQHSVNYGGILQDPLSPFNEATSLSHYLWQEMSFSNSPPAPVSPPVKSNKTAARGVRTKLIKLGLITPLFFTQVNITNMVLGSFSERAC